MSKLLKLKEWLTIPDTAKYLSITFGEGVKESDVLRLALDGHLKLSIILVNGAYGSRCTPVTFDEIEWEELPIPDGGTRQFPKNGRLWDDEKQGTCVISKIVSPLESGVWDLPMTGGERIDVEYRYHQLTDGPKVKAASLEGVFVAATNGQLQELKTHYGDNEYFQGELKKPFDHDDNFHPAGALPSDSVFVVRTQALREFELKQFEETSKTEKPESSRKIDNLLRAIACVAMSKYEYKPQDEKSAVPSQLANAFIKYGYSPSEKTVREWLKSGSQLLEADKEK